MHAFMFNVSTPHTIWDSLTLSHSHCWKVPARHWDAHRRQCALENRDKLEHLSSPSPGEHDADDRE